MIDTRRLQPRVKRFIAYIQWPITITLVLLNIVALVFDLCLIFKCLFRNCSFVADPKENSTHNHSKSCMKDYSFVKNEAPYHDMQKLVITMATLSGTLSYIFMIFALLRHYKTWPWNRNRNGNSEKRIVNPFLSGLSSPAESYYIQVNLNGEQLFYFYLMLLLNLVLFAANTGVLFYLVHKQDNKPSHLQTIFIIADYAGIVTMQISQYSAIISCFIFSKVAYAIMRQCNEMLQKYQANRNSIEDLEKTDLDYVNLNKYSMKPYTIWFTVHWILYTISAFITMAYLAETIIQRMYGEFCHCRSECKFFILYVFLLTIEHLFLFLYPCFRAASILEARRKLIKDVSREERLDYRIKYHFLNFMEKQRCGFVLSIFCARIEFGFNLAYLSLFIGLLGVIIKLCV